LTTDIFNQYESEKELLFKEQQALQRLTTLFSWLRLACFLTLLIFIYLFSTAATPAYLIIALLMGFALMFLIVYHQKLFNRLEMTTAMLNLVENELNVLHRKPSFFDDGIAYSSRLPFADDLDLFGKYSLFHFLNRCSTVYGKELLADSLLTKVPDNQHIICVQEAIKEIAGFEDFRKQVMARLLVVDRRKGLSHLSIDAKKLILLFKHPFFGLIRFILPTIVFTTLVYAILTDQYTFFMLAGSVSMILAFFQSKKMLLLHNEISGHKDALEVYAQVLMKFGALHVRSAMLSEMQELANRASQQFRRLSVLSEWFDRRNNMLLFALGNIFFQFDVNLAVEYEKWKKLHYGVLPDWLAAVGRIEMLISFGVFHANHPSFVFPELSAMPEIQAVELGHPLISPEQLVTNDIHLKIDPRIQLVTGSNMSGKSTYLRTLGVNVILAQAGAPVCAREFRWKPCLVLSSLRQSDSLHENTSLFLNELKQLQWILLEIQLVDLSLVLLDEVLRGTNSDDKYTGTHKLLQKLMDFQCLAVVATHDLKLSEMEKEFEGRFVNFCFESRLTGGKLYFDYTIKKGVAVNRNATWLMQDMGIIG